jgi:hypothetical protein
MTANDDGMNERAVENELKRLAGYSTMSEKTKEYMRSFIKLGMRGLPPPWR